MSIYSIRAALNAAIRTAAQLISGKNFSRKSALTAEVVIRLLIGAEGGSLDKMLSPTLPLPTISQLFRLKVRPPKSTMPWNTTLESG